MAVTNVEDKRQRMVTRLFLNIKIKMKRNRQMMVLIAICLAFITESAIAQDTMITGNGDILTVYDVEIGGSSIFYKLSPEDSTSHKIKKNDVMMIKYKNGELVKMDAASQEPGHAQTAVTKAPIAPDFGTNPNLEADNKALVDEFNNIEVVYKGDDTNKKANDIYFLLGLDEGSIIETSELKVTFKGQARIYAGRDQYKYVDFEEIDGVGRGLAVTVTNRTDKTVYLDLANCFLVKEGLAEPYYVPSSTSSTNGTATGGGVSLGAIANAVGIGGTLGTLAGGVSVGGGSSSSNTTVTYSQRVIPIPTKSSVCIGTKEITLNNTVKQYYMPELVSHGFFTEAKEYYKVSNNLKRGEKADLPQPEGASPLQVMITYALDENLSSTKTMQMGLHLRQAIAGGGGPYDNSDKKLLRNIEYSKYHPLLLDVLEYTGFRFNHIDK